MQVLSSYDTARTNGSVAAEFVCFPASNPSANKHSVTLHSASGLPMHLLAGRPVSARLTTSRAVQLVVKRAMDVVLATVALAILAPVLVLLAIVICLTSKGPALFRQDRDGLNGAVISVYKFRSMYVDRAGVTPIGRFIRRTSIDELPQLLNVIRGDMSLVGPRPHPVGLLAAGGPYEALVPYYYARHVMKPGISGWAQANGLRGPTDNATTARARIEHDIAYIQNFNLLLDIRIMIRTVLREFVTGTGY
ncbi:MAG: exopolysaccharide production protein [Devosia sp.]|nr:exopolysaccharide production protein [Devosia sp.]